MSHGTRSALLLAAALAGCAGANQAGVKVERWGEAPSKPPGCKPEILEKAPTRPYVALGEVTTHLTNPPPQGAISVVLPKACELGADAVIVQRNTILNLYGHVLVDVIAIRWLPEPPAVEPAQAATTEPLPPIQSVPQSGAGSLNPREPKR